MHGACWLLVAYKHKWTMKIYNMCTHIYTQAMPAGTRLHQRDRAGAGGREGVLLLFFLLFVVDGNRSEWPRHEFARR